MSMQSDDSNAASLAADYVMGLLEPAEQAEADVRIKSDAAFATLVEAWRVRLADFDSSAEPVTPSSSLWQRISETTKKDRIASLPGARAAISGATLWDNIRFWRITGLAGTFAAVTFAIVAIGALTASSDLRRDLVTLAQRKPIYVAVLVNDTTKEVGAVVNTFANGRVELIPLRNIEVPAGRALQIWTLWDRAVGPKSIGLTDESRTIQLNLDSLPHTVSDQLFEITLEPEGGSTIGRPTGPILFKGNAARTL